MTSTIDNYRAMMVQARIDSVDVPGTYLDRSPTGSGKSFADIPAVLKAGKSLVLLPTHKNCDEQFFTFNLNGVPAVAYPALTEETCENFTVASDCLKCGLNVSAAICPTCKLREGCSYLREMKQAESADHRLATHARGSRNLTELTAAAKYISIHEDPIIVIRPTEDSTNGFDQLIAVAECASGIAWNEAVIWLNNPLRAFFHKVIRTAEFFRDELASGDRTRPLQFSDFAVTAPRSAEAILFRAMNELKTRPPADTTRIVLAAAQGRLKSVTVRIDSHLVNGGGTSTTRSLQAVWHSEISEEKTVWFCDATGNPNELAEIIGRPVRDMTPSDRLLLRQPIIQIPLDVTKRTTPHKVIATLEAILGACPGFNRIGVITHTEHCPVVRGTAKADAKLSPQSQARITKVEHHRSGAGRGSNAWFTKCDLLIVLGTPRVPPKAVRTRLIQTNREAAATCTSEEAGWGPDYWLAKTVSGGARQIMFRTYRDHRWHDANRAIVASELKQAVGRGRGLLDSGIPVVVVTTEPLGYRVVDHDPRPITPSEAEILTTMRVMTEEKSTELIATGTDGPVDTKLTEQSPKIYVLANSSANPPSLFAREIGSRIGKSESYVSRVLTLLEQQGLVRRVGQRGGWITSGGTPPVLVKGGAGAGGDDSEPEGGAA